MRTVYEDPDGTFTGTLAILQKMLKESPKEFFSQKGALERAWIAAKPGLDKGAGGRGGEAGPTPAPRVDEGSERALLIADKWLRDFKLNGDDERDSEGATDV